MIVALSFMTALCVVAVLSGALVSRRLLRSSERERRAWEIERKELLDRVMYMADRPWSPPPMPDEPPVEDWDRLDLVWPELVAEEEE